MNDETRPPPPDDEQPALADSRPVFRCREFTHDTAGRRLAAAVWAFRCPVCRCTHQHRALTGRHVARCASGPYVELGYWLAREDGPAGVQRCLAAEGRFGDAPAPMHSALW